MRTIQNILIPVDLSSSNITSMLYGSELGLDFGATTHFVAAAPISDKPDKVPSGKKISKVALVDYLVEKVHAAVPDQNLQRTVVFHIERSCSRCDAIINYALNNSIDLIVVGSVQRSIIRHLLFGSLSDDLLRRAPCPVVRAPHGDLAAPKEEENEADNSKPNLKAGARRKSSP
ncbi:MAG: hypothetical protein BMS9Abin05_2082 [Rhodothermia bacterium]|nr:MAG: hypothetical protein BMS9Abin05_2082 [Rhodothermia bacterium]